MKFKSLLQLTRHFSDEKVCREYLANLRWSEGKPVCPHCEHEKVYNIEGGKRYKCANKECYKKFSVTSGTIFESTKIPLQDWFVAIYLITSLKRGISSCQLARDLNVTQKTSWFILQRVRVMLKDKAPELLDGIVEVDETYVGGKETNKQLSKRVKGLYGGKGKTPVIGLVQRGRTIQAHVVKSTQQKEVLPMMLKNVKCNAIVITDESPIYKKLNKTHDHYVVNHSREEYVRGFIYTNTIEGWFSQLKRGLIGTYYHCSKEQLQRYCDEFTFRDTTWRRPDTLR